MYDPAKLSVKKLPIAGTRTEAVVSRIEEGRLGDFVSAEALTKWDNPNPDAKSIRVTATNQDGVKADKIMSLPSEGNEVHPRSALGSWDRVYGGFPRVGQKVILLADENGYYRFIV